MGLLGCILGGCAHTAAPPATPAATPWVTARVGTAGIAEAPQLEDLAAAGTAGRVARLDRLLDLLDAARFGGDSGARSALWEALGGRSPQRGAAATAEAVRRLLDEALAIEDAAESDPLPVDTEEFLASALALLTTDVATPHSAQDLATRNLAYRNLLDRGHARVADNARWRLYDHVRGTLEGACEAPSDRRTQVAAQAVYAEQTRLPVPVWSPASLVALLEARRASLAADPQWRHVVERRRAQDEALGQRVLARLPPAWSPRWPAPTLAQTVPASGRDRPVLLVEKDAVVLGAGRPAQLRLPLRGDAAALKAALKDLGRDAKTAALTGFMPPSLASARVRALLDAAAAAGFNAFGIAVSTSEGSQTFGTLPLLVAQRGATTALAQALEAAPIVVTVAERGIIVTVDGAPLASEPASLGRFRERLDLVARAYPRSRTVRVEIGDGVEYGAAVDVFAAIVAGPQAPFSAVGYLAGAKPVRPRPPGGRGVEQRAALASPSHSALEQAFPLLRGDQATLEAFTAEMKTCLPELAVAPPAEGILVRLRFEAHRFDTVTLPRAAVAALGASATAQQRYRDCVRAVGHSVVLQQHADRVTVGVRYDWQP